MYISRDKKLPIMPHMCEATYGQSYSAANHQSWTNAKMLMTPIREVYIYGSEAAIYAPYVSQAYSAGERESWTNNPF